MSKLSTLQFHFLTQPFCRLGKDNLLSKVMQVQDDLDFDNRGPIHLRHTFLFPLSQCGRSPQSPIGVRIFCVFTTRPSVRVRHLTGGCWHPLWEGERQKKGEKQRSQFSWYLCHISISLKSDRLRNENEMEKMEMEKKEMSL